MELKESTCLTSGYTTNLQSSRQYGTGTKTEIQKYRSMEENRKPRDKSTQLWTPYLRQRRQECTMEKRQISLTSGAEKAMATHSSTLAWRITWTEEPGGLQSKGS